MTRKYLCRRSIIGILTFFWGCQLGLYGQQLEVEGDLDLKNHKVTQLGSPGEATDGVSKEFVDQLLIDFALSLGSTGIQALLDAGYDIQEMLDAGADPLQLVAGGMIKDSLYGKLYQGGFIFYLDDEDTIPGIQGMVAAPMDQSNSVWGCRGENLPGAERTKMGTGNENTKDIIAGCITTAIIAARRCTNLNLNGFSDWFLPSRDELEQVYWKLGQGAPAPNTNIGGFGNGFYWSSTESNANGASARRFLNNNLINIDKATPVSVRAVRAF